MVVLERSDWRERRRVATFPEKKEQNDSAIEEDGREFGFWKWAGGVPM